MVQQGFRRGRGSFVVLALGEQVLRQQVSLTARPILVQDPVQNLSQIDSARPPARLRGGNQRLDERPLLVRQIRPRRFQFIRYGLALPCLITA